MRVAAGLLLVAAAALTAAAQERPRALKDSPGLAGPGAEFRSRLERLSQGVSRGCDLFDGGKSGEATEAVPAPEASGGGQAQATPPPPAKPTHKEIATPGAVKEPAKVNPIQRMLEGTRNLAHKAKLTLQRILDGTRNL